MFDPQMELLQTVLVSAVGTPESGGRARKTWVEVREALALCGTVDSDLKFAVAGEDGETVVRILKEWHLGTRLLSEHDRGVLKRALKAFRKSFKVTSLLDESSMGGGPASSGRRSTIFGITPPSRYPRSVWDELVRQKRLVDVGRGMYGLPKE